MPLDEVNRIDDCELVTVFEDLDIVTRRHGDDRENRTVRLPALGAAAGMVISNVALDADFDRIARDLGPLK